MWGVFFFFFFVLFQLFIHWIQGKADPSVAQLFQGRYQSKYTTISNTVHLNIYKPTAITTTFYHCYI
jgi:hypothetical protein